MIGGMGLHFFGLCIFKFRSLKFWRVSLLLWYSRIFLQFRKIAKFLREYISARIHVAHVFAPAKNLIQERTGELFMYGFVPGGINGGRHHSDNPAEYGREINFDLGCPIR